MDFKNIKKVAFRIEPRDGKVTAFYPDEPTLFGDLYIACSMQGQHMVHMGRGSYRASKPAKPEEYRELQAELEAEGVLSQTYFVLTKIK